MEQKGGGRENRGCSGDAAGEMQGIVQDPLVLLPRSNLHFQSSDYHSEKEMRRKQG